MIQDIKFVMSLILLCIFVNAAWGEVFIVNNETLNQRIEIEPIYNTIILRDAK